MNLKAMADLCAAMHEHADDKDDEWQVGHPEGNVSLHPPDGGALREKMKAAGIWDKWVKDAILEYSEEEGYTIYAKV